METTNISTVNEKNKLASNNTLTVPTPTLTVTPPSPSASAVRPRRKLSIPAALTPTTINPAVDQTAIRRRFSNVGDAVSRKLSTTIGWKLMGGSPPPEVVAVGRALCTLYIRTRLKRAGLFNRKLGLTRVRSAIGSLEMCGPIAKEVFPGLSCACAELERLYPRLYTNILRQISPLPSAVVGGLLLGIGHHLFRSEPTWGKLIAVYSVAGGLAVDCVRQGHPEHLHVLLQDMTDLLEERMANWVHSNGGWTGLNQHCRPEDQEVSIVEYLAIFALVIGILSVAYFMVRFFVKFSVI